MQSVKVRDDNQPSFMEGEYVSAEAEDNLPKVTTTTITGKKIKKKRL